MCGRCGEVSVEKTSANLAEPFERIEDDALRCVAHDQRELDPEANGHLMVW